MGQKVNPIGLRLGINKAWDSIWFDEKKFSDRINEDILIRRYIENRFNRASLSKISINRKPSKRRFKCNGPGQGTPKTANRV